MTDSQQLTFLVSARDKWLLIGLAIIYGAAFLLYFQPFGINNHDPAFKIDFEFFIVTSSFGIQMALLLILTEFVLRPRLLKTWTMKTLVMWYFLVGIAGATTTFLYYNFLGNWHDMRWPSYFEFLRDIPIMMCIPLVGVVLYFRFRETRKNLWNAKKLNQKLFVPLVSGNGKEKFTIDLDHLLLVEGQENYVAIHYKDQNVVKKKLIRNTMASIEKQFHRFPVKRCHRSYMINTRKVSGYHKKKGVAYVRLTGIEREIPVSAKYSGNMENIEMV